MQTAAQNAKFLFPGSIQYCAILLTNPSPANLSCANKSAFQFSTNIIANVNDMDYLLKPGERPVISPSGQRPFLIAFQRRCANMQGCTKVDKTITISPAYINNLVGGGGENIPASLEYTINF